MNKYTILNAPKRGSVFGVYQPAFKNARGEWQQFIHRGKTIQFPQFGEAVLYLLEDAKVPREQIELPAIDNEVPENHDGW